MDKPIPKVLIFSSTVASSRIGATAAAFCLRRLGVEAVVLPTTLMGRHPGWGIPGGGAVEVDKLRDIWTGVRAQNISFDAVLSGYMGERAHIDLCAEIIADVRASNPKVKIMVDPVMGDHSISDKGISGEGRLYIPEDRAEAICDTLIPLADMITPNQWEYDFIRARQSILPRCLITSVPDGAQIGVRYMDGRDRWQVSHPKFDSVPHGGGDSLAALFLGRLLLGEPVDIALGRSVAAIYDIMHAANTTDAGELPLVRMQASITDAASLKVTHSHD